MPLATSVLLIPWDPDSDDHIKRLIGQREQCGWESEIVEPLWRGKQRLGNKCIYWIVLISGHPDAEDSLQLHFDLFPAEKTPLRDTAVSISSRPREPTKSTIYPIGHISLDIENADAKHLELDLPLENVYWIKTFYVSKALQSKDIGRAAMDIIESMAIDEPLYARTLALDTIHKDDVTRMAVEEPGEVPKMTNHEWYERRGYYSIETLQNFYQSLYKGRRAPNMKTVFMRKDIAQELYIASAS